MRIGRCTLLPWRTRPCSSSWPRSTPQSRQRSRPSTPATQALHLQIPLPQGSYKSTFMAAPFAVCGRSAHLAHAWPCFANVCVKTVPPQSETRAAQGLGFSAAGVAAVSSLDGTRETPLTLQYSVNIGIAASGFQISHFSTGSFAATVARYPPDWSLRKIDGRQLHADYAAVSEVPI
jgi:hypothetical protein